MRIGASAGNQDGFEAIHVELQAHDRNQHRGSFCLCSLNQNNPETLEKEDCDTTRDHSEVVRSSCPPPAGFPWLERYRVSPPPPKLILIIGITCYGVVIGGDRGDDAVMETISN